MKKIILFTSLLFLSTICSAKIQINPQEEIRKNITEPRNEISFGLENYSKTTDINGGNYLFLEYHYQLLSQLSFGGKVSADLVPLYFEDVLLHGGLRFNTKSRNELISTIGMYYMYSVKNNQNKDFITLDLALLTYLSDKGDFEMSFLPVSLIYSFDAEKLSINYKFLGIRINF